MGIENIPCPRGAGSRTPAGFLRTSNFEALCMSFRFKEVSIHEISLRKPPQIETFR